MLALALPLLLASSAAAVPAQVPLGGNSTSPRPLVVWHGLGDSAHSQGMDGFFDAVREVHPGIFVHSVVVPPDGSAGDESKAGWWGLAEEQGQQGCDQIKAIPELADGFDAIGFSQGGLFLRWYAQFCDGPEVKNLITFGTPHFGIAALIPCPTPPTLSCTLAARAAKAGIYTRWAQAHLVQAQYFRDPARLDEFLLANTFVRDLNAEGGLDDEGEPTGREHGGKGLGGLENVVAVAFEDDRTLVPALSAHWATQTDNGTLPLRAQQLYTEDWIGLRALDERGGLHLPSCPGQHMEIGGDGGCGERMVRKWVGWRV